MNDGEHEDQDDDLELVDRLGAIARTVDGPPAEVVAAARAAFTWRTIDAELAELVYDSWLDDQVLTGVRAAGGLRRLRFDAEELKLEVEVEAVDGSGCQLVGQVVPPRPGVVEVRHAERSLSVPVDGLGRFSVPRVPSGNISLRCRAEGGPTVDTTWVVAC